MKKKDYSGIFHIPNSDGRENRRSCGNAYKNKIGSGLFSIDICPKVDTMRHFQSIQALK